MPLQDSFGRRFSYLRLSVTDACNFRCAYCLPHGYRRTADAENYLSVEEIRHLATALGELGMWKIRVTGGEPTLRSDLFEILRTLRTVPGVQKIGLSTNAYRLRAMAGDLYRAGLDALNVSVDTLDRKKFFAATGQDRLDEIRAGIDEALAQGFPTIKINAVLMKDVNADEVDRFTEWIRDRPLTVRFIELMPTGQNQEFFRAQHVRGATLVERWLRAGWRARPRAEGDGPAVEYVHPDFRGRLGIIAPYAQEFCSTCNRLRVTSDGKLRLCLFGESNTSLREYLRSADQKESLKAWMVSQLARKEVSHYLPEGRYGNTQTFSTMGG